jgi:hypothetical protein
LPVAAARRRDGTLGQLGPWDIHGNVIAVPSTYFGSVSVRLRQRVLVKRVLHLSNKLWGK